MFCERRVLRGGDFRRICRNRPISENRVKFDSRRLHQPSLACGCVPPVLGELRLGKPRICESNGSVGSQAHEKAGAAPELAEESSRPDAKRRRAFLAAPQSSTPLQSPPLKAAIDSGDTASGPAADQRSVVSPQARRPRLPAINDTGAFEFARQSGRFGAGEGAASERSRGVLSPAKAARYRRQLG